VRSQLLVKQILQPKTVVQLQQPTVPPLRARAREATIGTTDNNKRKNEKSQAFTRLRDKNVCLIRTINPPHKASGVDCPTITSSQTGIFHIPHYPTFQTKEIHISWVFDSHRSLLLSFSPVYQLPTEPSIFTYI